MTNRITIHSRSPEWAAMWGALARYEAERGQSILDKGWTYIGTERGDTGWKHLFRHVNHPQTRRTMVVSITPTVEWREKQDEG